MDSICCYPSSQEILKYVLGAFIGVAAFLFLMPDERQGETVYYVNTVVPNDLLSEAERDSLKTKIDSLMAKEDSLRTEIISLKRQLFKPFEQ